MLNNLQIHRDLQGIYYIRVELSVNYRFSFFGILRLVIKLYDGVCHKMMHTSHDKVIHKRRRPSPFYFLLFFFFFLFFKLLFLFGQVELDHVASLGWLVFFNFLFFSVLISQNL